jgi:hypothetical protein
MITNSRSKVKAKTRRMNMDALGYGKSVDDAIAATAARAGMDPAYWRAVASIESRLTPNSNYDKPTQYKGLFQIGTRDTPEGKSEWTRHGSGNIYNAMDNARTAAELAAENNARFQAHYGRAPTPIETYMMHQQGLGFYTNGTMTNIAGNPYPGMSGPQTPQSFEAGWARELERRAKGFGGQPSGNYPQSVAGTRSQAVGGVAPKTSALWSADSTGQGADATTAAVAGGASDIASQLSGIRDRFAKEDEASSTPQLQPLQMPQQMMTPAMMRARMIAQVMLARQMGINTNDETNT